MKKFIFLLIMMCITFTGCKKDQNTESELHVETTSIQMEMPPEVSNSEQTSTTTATLSTETTDLSSQASSSTSQTLVTSVTTMTTTETTAEIPLDAGNALREAMDKEERDAIQAVQSEDLIYYKNSTLNFDRKAYANLNIDGVVHPISTGTHHGSNIHQYFFESNPMSGTDILYLQKACEGYSGTAFDVNQVKSSTGDSLENSECLTYQNDSAYVELHQDGTCRIYNKNHLSEILGQEIPSGMWNPLQGSQSNVTIYSSEPNDNFIPIEELIYPLNGENVSIAEAIVFLNDYFIKADWISSLYQIEAYIPITVELIEYENGSYGYYFTFSLFTDATLIGVDSTEKTAYQNPDRAINGQYVQFLMLSKDSVDYIYLPPTLTRMPDYVQTVSGMYCTLSEACEILSEYLSSDHVYDVGEISVYYETVFLGDLGIVQSPMWHFEVTSLTGEEAKYNILYADIDLETKELYVSYH